jgi:hypothetical protein
MDEATKAYRRRMKAQAGPRGQLPEWEPKGLGRARKPAGTFPAQQCAYRDAESGIRCRKTAEYSNVKFKTMFGLSTGAFCPGHLAK